MCFSSIVQVHWGPLSLIVVFRVQSINKRLLHLRFIIIPNTLDPFLNEYCYSEHPVRACSHYEGNGIIFIILVSSNVDFTIDIATPNGGVYMAMSFLWPEIFIATTVWTGLYYDQISLHQNHWHQCWNVEKFGYRDTNLCIFVLNMEVHFSGREETQWFIVNVVIF